MTKLGYMEGRDFTMALRWAGGENIKAGSAIIDGEIVVPAADGTTDFSVLQNEFKGRSTSIVLIAFDLLYEWSRHPEGAARHTEGRTEESTRSLCFGRTQTGVDR